MRIGIIGAGFIGRAVAQRVMAAGHQAMLSNARGPHTLTEVLAEIPGSQIGSVEEAAQFGNVVLLAIPFAQCRQVSASLLAGKIVLDANNYYPGRDGHVAALDGFATTTSRLIAEHFAGSHLVKVFNAILAEDLVTDARSKHAPDRRALPVAADDQQAKELIMTLLDEIGFDPVDAGSLDDSWRFERAKPAYCIPFDKAGLKQALAKAERTVELPHGSWRHAQTPGPGDASL